MSNLTKRYDDWRVIQPPLMEGENFSLHVVLVAGGASDEFLNSVGWKTKYYGVLNTKTGVLEFETPFYGEAINLMRAGEAMLKALNEKPEDDDWNEEGPGDKLPLN